MFDEERCKAKTKFDDSKGVITECNTIILTMAYKGTGACGEEHLKFLTNDYAGTSSANQYGKKTQ
jgi:hypothetical protein